jgi:hypothetical protein
MRVAYKRNLRVENCICGIFNFGNEYALRVSLYDRLHIGVFAQTVNNMDLMVGQMQQNLGESPHAWYETRWFIVMENEIKSAWKKICSGSYACGVYCGFVLPVHFMMLWFSCNPSAIPVFYRRSGECARITASATWFGQSRVRLLLLTKVLFSTVFSIKLHWTNG